MIIDGTEIDLHFEPVVFSDKRSSCNKTSGREEMCIERGIAMISGPPAGPRHNVEEKGPR